MAAKIVNLVYPDEDNKLCATVEKAEKTLAAMVERFKSEGYRIEEQRLHNEDYPQFAVYDRDDAWIGTYTVIV